MRSSTKHKWIVVSLAIVSLAVWIAFPSQAQLLGDPQSHPGASQARLGNLRFQRAVLQSARKSNMTIREIARLRIGLMFHGRAIESQIAAKAWNEGAIPDNFDAQGRYKVAEINWDELGDFLERVLPLILDFLLSLLDAFGGGLPSVGPDIGDASMSGSISPLFIGDPDAALEAEIDSLRVYRAPNIVPRSDAPQQPQRRQSVERKVVMYTIDDCEPCRAFEVAEKPQLVGCRFVTVLNPQPPKPFYPWFELFFGDRRIELARQPRTADQILDVFDRAQKKAA